MLVLSCLQLHERTLHTPFGFIKLMGSAEDPVKHAVRGVITIEALDGVLQRQRLCCQ